MLTDLVCRCSADQDIYPLILAMDVSLLPFSLIEYIRLLVKI